MTTREDKMVQLTVYPITKIIRELEQGGLKILEAELEEWVTKIKTT